MFLLINFIIVLMILLVGCYSDLKQRSASNTLWLVLGAFGLIINSSTLNFEALYTVMVIGFVSILVYAAKWIGGADIKALLGLSLMYPHNLVFLVYVIVLACIVSLFVLVLKPKYEKDYPFLFSLLCGFIISSVYFVIL